MRAPTKPSKPSKGIKTKNSPDSRGPGRNAWTKGNSKLPRAGC
jgi:hypothetical protein